jgi:vacuolar protein 8
MQSTNAEVQCNAVGCLTNLATNGKPPMFSIGIFTSPHSQTFNIENPRILMQLLYSEGNKAKIARSGALGPLTKLAKSKDLRVQVGYTIRNGRHRNSCFI